MLFRNDKILWRELDGEAILLDPREGCSYNLNVIGTLIWKMLDGTHTVSDIATAICESYEVDFEQASHDVQQLLDDLHANHLLSDVTTPSHTTV
ncbi:MAG TPA: PqqD family protein [Ktedonobacteraceae bacterium]|nr:PqqD family protein [Ktedonobacteraceae bacterium]